MSLHAGFENPGLFLFLFVPKREVSFLDEHDMGHKISNLDGCCLLIFDALHVDNRKQ